MCIVRLDKCSSGDTIKVPIGGTVIIELDEIPTTGYRWKAKYLATNIIKDFSSDFISKSKSITGGGGKRVFKFLVQDIGEVTLYFFNMRPWEGEKTSVSRYTFTIQVLEQ